MTPNAELFRAALVGLDRPVAYDLLTQAVEQRGVDEALETIVVPALDNIGCDWDQGSISLAQVYMSGRICEDLVSEVLPTGAPTRRTEPRLAICVLEDSHMLGKRIVLASLRASGFELLDYGRVTVLQLAERVRADNIGILLISTLMLPSALMVRQARAAIDTSVRIIVGGAPFRFDGELWREVGADAMCRTASDAVAAVQRIIDAKETEHLLAQRNR